MATAQWMFADKMPVRAEALLTSTPLYDSARLSLCLCPCLCYKVRKSWVPALAWEMMLDLGGAVYVYAT